jgi:hypothetical protein
VSEEYNYDKIRVIVPGKAEVVCKNLSVQQKNLIRNKILPRDPDQAPFYMPGEALVFWLADWLIPTKLIKPEMFRSVLEEIRLDVSIFGNVLYRSLRDFKDNTKLPVCKLGFLDRRYVCIEGRDTFFDSEREETVTKLTQMPFETVSYNLTVLYLRYVKEMEKLQPCYKEGANNG